MPGLRKLMGSLGAIVDKLGLARPGRPLAYSIYVNPKTGLEWQTQAAHALRWRRWRRLLDTRAAGFGDYLAALPPSVRQRVPRYSQLLDVVRALDNSLMGGQAMDNADPGTRPQMDRLAS